MESQIALLQRGGWGADQLVTLTSKDRRCHTYVIGKTGSGKSTLLKNLLIQEINNGSGVGLIDPHGDLAADLLEHIGPERASNVVYFNPADAEHPCSLNVLHNGSTSDLVASGVVSAFKNIWRASWGPRLEYVLYASVAALADCENVSLLAIPRLLSDEPYRRWVVRQVKDPMVRSFWAVEFESYDKKFKTEVISPIQNKIGQFLMSPAIRNILGQVKNSIDFREVLDRGQIFIANLSKGHLGEEQSRLLGALLVSQFQLAAMSRARVPHESRRDFGLVIDEFHNFVTESFCTILSESRKYGLHMTLSHQYTQQLQAEIRDAVFGNAGTFICFRVGNADAELLAKEIGDFSPSQLSSLASFEVAARVTIGGIQTEPFLGKSLPPLGERFGRSDSIVKRCRQCFCRRREDVEDKILRWLASRDV